MRAGMKLLTHNMLSCHIKGVQNGFPFKIEATKVDEVDADYDPDFLRRMYPRLEWSALCEAAQSLGAEKQHACMCNVKTGSARGMIGTAHAQNGVLRRALQVHQICRER